MSLGFLCAGIGHQEMGSGALAMRGATGGGFGGPAKPLAQQGRIMMQSLQIFEKQEVHGSVMRVRLHLSHDLCSIPDGPDRAFGGDMQNFDMSSCRRPEVFALSVRLSK